MAPQLIFNLHCNQAIASFLLIIYPFIQYHLYLRHQED
jgi:hypothetical protein